MSLHSGPLTPVPVIKSAERGVSHSELLETHSEETNPEGHMMSDSRYEEVKGRRGDKLPPPFVFPTGTPIMETSASRAAEKKDKMDGSSFSDLPKKPSLLEARGKTASERPAVQARRVTGRVCKVLSWRAKAPTPGMKYTFQRWGVISGAPHRPDQR